MKHNQGRNPEYAIISTPMHKPLLKAVKTYSKAYSGGERVALGTTLAELALDGSHELQALYDKELERKDGDAS